MADFPGMFLENYIDPEVSANITVLHGSVALEYDGKNHSLSLNETVQVPRNQTHIVHVTSATPACYMYESFNVTLEGVGVADPDDVDRGMCGYHYYYGFVFSELRQPIQSIVDSIVSTTINSSLYFVFI